MTIERGHPSTAFRTMPHLVTFDVKPQPIDELTGNSDSFFGDELHVQADALNETTNFRPQQGESTSIVHPEFRTGLISPDQMRPVDSLSETFGDGDPRILGPISGNGVFKPQDIEAKGSVIWGDNHFTPDRGGDSLTGDGRPMNVWTNGSATSFEDRVFYGIDPDIQRPSHPNDNIGTNSDSYFGDEIHFFTPVASQNGTATFAGSFNLEKGDLPHEGEIFQPARGMNSFGESLNPVSELGGTAGPGATSFMTGRENFDVVGHGVMASKLNFDVVVH